MDLKHLRTFVAAAEEEGFTRAGERLNLTQAAVSQHVAALERELDCQLFERAGRSVHLSDRGKRLYEYARRILDLVQEAIDDLQGAVELQGTLAIAASTVPAEWLLPELLSGFRRLHPQVRESLTVSDSEHAAIAVEQSDVLLGFVGERPVSSDLDAKPIVADDLVLVVAPTHEWSAKGTATVNALAQAPLIMREAGSGTRHCVEEALAANGVDLTSLNIVMEANSNEAIRLAVQRGSGVAFLSEHTVADDIERGRLKAIKVRGLRPKRQLYLITRKDRVLPSPAREFLTYVNERAKTS